MSLTYYIASRGLNPDLIHHLRAKCPGEYIDYLEPGTAREKAIETADYQIHLFTPENCQLSQLLTMARDIGQYEKEIVAIIVPQWELASIPIPELKEIVAFVYDSADHLAATASSLESGEALLGLLGT